MTQVEAWALSIAIEAPVAAALLLATGWGRPARGALAAALGTLASHPAAWAAHLALQAPLGYALATVLVEAGVVLGESLAYRALLPLSIGRAAATSLAANAVSTMVGLASYALAAG